MQHTYTCCLAHMFSGSMYCTNCTTVFSYLFNDPENYHRSKVEIGLHDGLSSLERSAAAGCQCCRLIRHVLLAQENNTEYSPHLNQGAEIKLVRERQHFKSQDRVQVVLRFQILNWERPLALFYEKFHEELSESIKNRRSASSVNEHIIGGLLPGRVFGETSNDIFELMREWLDRCETGHGSFCTAGETRRVDTASSTERRLSIAESPSRLPFLPTRLVEITCTPEKDSKFRLRLVLSRGITQAAREQGYTTLSYCWGKYTDFFTTTKENYEAHLEDISFEALPKTFKDAVVVTYKLGYVSDQFLRYVRIYMLSLSMETHMVVNGQGL